jgi:hypothetical protein
MLAADRALYDFSAGTGPKVSIDIRVKLRGVAAQNAMDKLPMHRLECDGFSNLTVKELINGDNYMALAIK